MAQSARSKQKLAVLFIDMDRFKAINDSLGHQAGDDVLIQIAKRLGICIRRESDIIARLGGDEFVVVLTELEDVTAAALIATTIIYTLSQSYVYGHHELHTSPSIGISVFPLDGNTPEELLKNSDIAMYHAKEKGRNNYQFYTESMNAEVKEILVLENDLRSAIQKNQLELYYQPQIQTSNNIICGVEALLRWKHPTQGFIPPDKFIPIAEDSGQILDLGTWVLDKACAQLSEWLAQGIAKIHIAVNVSAHQLKSKNFVKAVKATLEKYQLSANQLELEITETVAMENPEFAIEQLVLLHEIGVLLSIDDFGTGYSSLAYLKMFPIQTLKLDRTFVKNIGEDENDEAICAATISLSHSLGLKVVAEGVETVEQQQFLKLRNCDILQGYLFSRPLPVNEVTDFIKSYNSKI